MEPHWVMKKVKKRQTKIEILYEMQGGECVYCQGRCYREFLGERPVWMPKEFSATLEHIVPRSQKGSFDLGNLFMACYGCNQARGSMDFHKFMKRYVPNRILRRKQLENQIEERLMKGLLRTRIKNERKHDRAAQFAVEGSVRNQSDMRVLQQEWKMMV